MLDQNQKFLWLFLLAPGSAGLLLPPDGVKTDHVMVFEDPSGCVWSR